MASEGATRIINDEASILPAFIAAIEVRARARALEEAKTAIHDLIVVGPRGDVRRNLALRTAIYALEVLAGAEYPPSEGGRHGNDQAEPAP